MKGNALATPDPNVIQLLSGLAMAVLLLPVALRGPAKRRWLRPVLGFALLLAAVCYVLAKMLDQ